jgi:hypothetical protein
MTSHRGPRSKEIDSGAIWLVRGAGKYYKYRGVLSLLEGNR